MNNEKFDNVDLASEIPVEIHQLPYGYNIGVLYFQFEKKSLSSDNSLKTQLSNIFPVLIMFLIITIQTRVYIFWYLLPALELSNSLSTLPTPSNTYHYELYLFLLFSLTFLTSTLLTISTPPGEIDEELSLNAENLRSDIYQVSISEAYLNKIQKISNNERKRTLFPRFCRTCLKVKPDRSHHCSVCNKCVLKMDHHCPYVNNCIGLMNYKYFMNMIISATCCCLLISCTMWEGVRNMWSDLKCDLNYQVFIGISYFGGVLLTVVLTAFCFFHFYLIFFGLSTIELREKLTVKFERSPYDRGCFRNFLEVFGNNPLCWLVPVSKFYLGPEREKVFTFEKNEGF